MLAVLVTAFLSTTVQADTTPLVVLSGGGGVTSNTSHTAFVTIGQPFTGVAGNGTTRASFGFWYAAGVADPCDADWNGDGGVGVLDLLAYLALWFEGDPAADLTGDPPPAVDILDLLVFLDRWFSGCP